MPQTVPDMCVCVCVCVCAQVAEFVDRAVHIAQNIKSKTGNKLKDFRDYVNKTVSLKRHTHTHKLRCEHIMRRR